MFKSFLCVLFAILYAVAVDARDQGDHSRNAATFFIGFGVGLVIVGAGVGCWVAFEGMDVCKKGGINKNVNRNYDATKKTQI
mmetsp:Transcript_6158/g.7631  ORF Transcript_6158/g.7631 Transcript_6158/m.7631 type:complete len:82 (+) Transcript_6158:121-366(+)